MPLADHPSSLGGNVFQRPAEVDGVQAKLGKEVSLVTPWNLLQYRGLLWVDSIWSRTEGNWWAPHKRNSADFERRGSNKCRCLREGVPVRQLERPEERQLQSALTGGAARWLDGIARSM